MSKSVYSIVLSDDVVAAVDMLALRLGTNRSGLIDSILASRLNVTTPEQRIRDIFDSIFSLMDERFIQDGSSANSAIALRSSIAYKYKPTVRYNVELLRVPENDKVGSLKISFRTRSAAFMQMLAGFFQLWINTEGRYNNRDIVYKAESDKLIRPIYLPKDKDIRPEQLGEVISEYIYAFDTALKQYFANADDPEKAKQAVIAAYTARINKNIDKI